ncbi:MAG: efflux RND transporter periplasmic adaptor subunit [Candidatus Sumerlaeia bacterium]|nr:efflux RND transporter periplasmic adaptor subunit [Candidatus Sumerlaeia bacterium]
MKTLLRALAFVAGIALLGFVMAWLAGAFEEQVAPGRVAAPAVFAAGTPTTVEAIDEQVFERAVGTIRAREETAVSSRIASRIVSMHVRAGDSVEEGQVLVRLDERDLVSRVEQARQAAEAAGARRDEALSDFDRTRQLFESNVRARSDLDRAEAALKGAEAELARATRIIEEAEAALSHATLASPIAGRVVDRFAEPGDLATPGVALVRLYDPASLRLEADVRESLATGLRIGQRLDVHIDSLDRTVAGIVQEIVPFSDPGSRSFVVKVALEDPQGLYPGMFARLPIPRGTRRVLAVPAGALERTGQIEAVWLATDPPRRRMVRTGESRPAGTVEILSGLAAGERVLVP